MATRDQIQKLATAANLLRPDWPTNSLVTYLMKAHAARPFQDLATALTFIALDPETKSPARLEQNGPWWKAVQVAAGSGPVTATPGPGDEPACDRVGHEHELARNCRACAAERLADTEASEAPMVAAPAPAAIREVANRHRVRAAAVGAPLTRSFVQTEELRQPDGFGVATCGRAACGAYYVDDEQGAQAHFAVFGHRPEPTAKGTADVQPDA
jgi:hypothetical protein